MRFVAISGSHREKSQSIKVTKWLAAALADRKDAIDTDIIDLGGNSYPLWDQSAWSAESNLAQKMKPELEKITKADAVILVAPEWGGMVPGALKNFLLYVSSAHAAHKPCLLVGVSAGRGGSYPIAELRMSGYKNNRLVFIPDHLIVTNAENVMNDPILTEGSDDDQYIKKRAHYSLEVLVAYAKALKDMRESTDLTRKEYPFGM
ncbi:MAG: NADPH-dependent oxidoreductase [Alphaproteobacteria bacterium]|nr:NADPH-dependent oxidoreductase [Alphaproteobacteria bacterium]